MNLPDDIASDASLRVQRAKRKPQLFNAAASGPSPDFGPSILSAIDGQGAATGASQRATTSRHRGWKGLALVAAMAAVLAVGWGLQEANSHSAPEVASHAVPAPSRVSLSPPSPATLPVVHEPAGAAVITAEASPAPAPAAAPRDAGAAPSAPSRTEAAKAPVRTARAHPPKPKAAASTTRGVQPADGDAELIGAMLPHLDRLSGGAERSGFERRCGGLERAQLHVCRVRYCNGRQGTEAACP